MGKLVTYHISTNKFVSNKHLVQIIFKPRIRSNKYIKNVKDETER